MVAGRPPKMFNWSCPATSATDRPGAGLVGAHRPDVRVAAGARPVDVGVSVNVPDQVEERTG